MWRGPTCCLLVVACAAWGGPDGGAPPPTASAPASRPAYAPTSDYEERPLEGWTLRVHKDLLDERRAALWAATLREVENQLYRITRAVPPKAVKELRKVVIWVEYRDPKTANACYHPSPGWLRANGYNPDKAKGVEIGSAARFLKDVGHEPWMVLHELAHAYHHQVLGWNHPEVKAAYEAAKRGGTYEKVLIWNGRVGRHYAMTDHKEYFAENTEAYFGTNDIYPFVRAELRKHDPVMYGLLERLWGVKRPPSPQTQPSRPGTSPPPQRAGRTIGWPIVEECSRPAVFTWKRSASMWMSNTRPRIRRPSRAAWGAKESGCGSIRTSPAGRTSTPNTPKMTAWAAAAPSTMHCSGVSRR